MLDFGGNVYMIDLASRKVISTLKTDVEQAWTLKLSLDGKRGYVAGAYGFAILDVTANTLLSSVKFIAKGEFSHVHGRAMGVKPDSLQYLVGLRGGSAFTLCCTIISASVSLNRAFLLPQWPLRIRHRRAG